MSSESKVADANIILVVNKDVFRFEVTMNYRRRMYVNKAVEDLAEQSPTFFRFRMETISNKIPQSL